jgi:pyruvate-formate lyase-activating enzyme
MPGGRFLVELIKPSHYDDDGYVIQWVRGWIPSNSLSSVFGLMLDLQARRVLGDDVDIEVNAYDETNTVVPIERIIRRFRGNGLQGLVCLVGVQTNQFPRALDIARPLRAAGIQVVIGGFHVSGCLAMLAEPPPDLAEARALGITLFAGEAEGRLEALVCAAHEQRLEPVYNHLEDLPHLDGQPIPFLPARLARRYAGTLGSFDAGRGCPFSCSFCTIINVQGRKSRHRNADDVEQIVRANAAQGVHQFFVTDDNFARNRSWEAIFDRLAELRELHGFRLHLTIQVDTLCHRLPHFIEKAARAGCKRVFIGLESINPASLKAASKGQNRITEYRTMLQAWRAAGVITYAGYILGFPTDTPESIARDIGIIQRELPIDILEFFILTPLPGSADHKALHLEGVSMDPDMNAYDLEHVTTGHPRMTREQWQSTYDRAWHLYYSREHIETLLKRAIATNIKSQRLAAMIFYFFGSHRYERLHPLQSGILRRKIRTQRRPGLPREHPLAFYAWRAREIVATYGPGMWFLWRLGRLRRRLERDPSVRRYTDVAIAPIEGDDGDALELYQATVAARRAVADARARSEAIRAARVGAAASRPRPYA